MKSLGRARNGRRGGKRTLSAVKHTVHIVAPTRVSVSVPKAQRSATPQPGQQNVATRQPLPGTRLGGRSAAATSTMRTTLSLIGFVSSQGRRLANGSMPVSLPSAGRCAMKVAQSALETLGAAREDTGLGG